MGTQFNANEFKTVDDLYSKGLGRQGDQGGLDYWRSQFGDSIDANEFNQFKQSAMPEYNSRGASQPAPQPAQQPAPQQNYQLPNSQYGDINALYKGVLGRDADQSGANYWASQFGDTIDSSEEAQFRQSAQQELDRKKAEDLQAQQNRQFNPYGTNPFANTNDPYIQAAQQTSAGNLAGAQMATSANRVNQQTPYQNLQYTQTGVDAQGNPIWNANQTLAPGFQQPLANIQSNIAAQTAKPFDVSATQNQQFTGQNPEFERMGQAPELQRQVEGTGMAGWDRANELLMSRLRPQMEQRRSALDSRLANQGIMPGTEAYNRAILAADQGDNDLMTQAQLAGQQVQNTQFNQNLAGGNFANQAAQSQNQMGLQNLGFNNATAQQGFGNQMAVTAANNMANQNNFAQNLSAYNNPLQQLSAFQQGTNPNYANIAAQQAVSGPNYLDAYNASIANQIAAQNAQMASQANQQSGIYSLINAGITGSGGIPGLVSGVGSAVSGIGKAYDWLTGTFK
jgi:hypothetical protein